MSAKNFIQFFPIRGHNPPLDAAQTANDLRVIGLAHHHGHAAPAFRVPDQLVNAGHIGAGGVNHPAPAGAERRINRVRLAVGADQHRRPFRNLPGRRDGHRPHALQPPDYIIIVGDVAQQEHRALSRRRFRQLHRTAHAVTETGGFSQPHVHAVPSPSARMRASRSSAMRW